MTSRAFDPLIQDALEQAFSGWDFSWLHGRWHEPDPAWDYRRLVEVRARGATSLLDMGTGGGEFLASLSPLPARTCATEGYAPNVPLARKRLAPLGIDVVTVSNDAALPLEADAFALVINRHESYDAAEVRRILEPGGRFLTQQVGPRNCVQLSQYFGAPVDPDVRAWTLQDPASELERAGLRVRRVEEQYLECTFFDIGAVVYYLKVIAWQVPDFTIERYHDRLFAMHQQIERDGAFYATSHRYLIEALKSRAHPRTRRRDRGSPMQRRRPEER
jgi:SAM-dependent methyltransferase